MTTKVLQQPFVWQMVKEAVQALGTPTSNIAVRDWILQHYPGTNVSTIQCQIITCTVNHPSRLHYSENKKPRHASGPYDFLFRPEKGKLELYDPSKHGSWRIAESDEGLLKVTEDEVEPLSDSKTGSGFAAESHLRDYLIEHLPDVEPGLQLFVQDDGTLGVEFVTDVGRIDILAIDTGKAFVVIELKVDDAPDKVCGQLMRYMG